MKTIISIVAVVAISIVTGFLLFQGNPPKSRKETARPPSPTLSGGPHTPVPLKDAGHVKLKTATAQEQRRNTWSKDLEEGVKLYKQGAFARTYARLEPVLSQSGLSEGEIVSVTSLYIDITFAQTREDRDKMIEKMKAQFGGEVYDGIEKSEEIHRNRIRDEQLLASLRNGIPSLSKEDTSAAMAGFVSLPNFNTLYLQAVKFQPPTVDKAANMKAVAETAFEKAFANSPISASAREQLKKTYVTIALSMTPAR